jgi:hypothetical protein
MYREGSVLTLPCSKGIRGIASQKRSFLEPSLEKLEGVDPESTFQVVEAEHIQKLQVGWYGVM